MGLSQQTMADMLNYFFRTRAITAPTNLYVSLHAAVPDVNGSNEFAFTNGYARVTVPATPSNWSAPAFTNPDTEIHNLVAITFTATGTWSGQVVGVGVWNSPTLTAGANFMGGGGTTNQAMAAGGTYTFDVGGLVIKLR